LNYKRLSKIGLGALLSSLPLFAIDAQVGKEIINSKCTACHVGNLEDGLSRISNQRKTPEGWFMTVKRMQREHGLIITEDEESNVIKYLSDYQGLTPDEIKPYSYVLDKSPNIQENAKNEFLTEMCVRCHSEARIGLQRRTTDEWNNLVHFHVGQFATLELQAKARDKDWIGVAEKDIVPYLAENFGIDKEKYEQYKKSINNFDLPLDWIIYGYSPKDGDFTANLNLKKVDNNIYSVNYKEEFNNKTFTAIGTAILYSANELRISLKDENNKKYKQILHIDPKNVSIDGRLFELLHPEIGSILKGKAQNSKDVSLLGIYPSAIKAGTKEILAIVGTNLSGEITLSNNLKVLKTIKHTSNEIVLEVEASNLVNTKEENILIGNSVFEKSIVLYNNIDYLKITPEYAVSRIGSEDEKIKKEYVQFEAIGFSNGPDKKQNTFDDIKLKKVPAIWNLEAYDKQAQKDKDVIYSGSINRNNGLFTPSESGPNPIRKMMTNNTGNLNVIGIYKDGEKELMGKSHMVVTVPKYINPPIN
jgi:quinohemoprotein amine dehydrogenase